MPDYHWIQTFAAADDRQARRLGTSWGGTCTAEYGTRDPVVVPADGELYDHVVASLADQVPADEYSPAAAASVAYDAMLPALAGLDIALRDARAEVERLRGELANERCTCGETACESELCDCDAIPCPVNHRAEQAEERLRIERAAYARIQAQADDAAAARDRWQKRAYQDEAEVERLRRELAARIDVGRTEHRELEQLRAANDQLRDARAEAAEQAEDPSPDYATLWCRCRRAEAENATLTAAADEYQRQIGYLADDVKQTEAELAALKAANERARELRNDWWKRPGWTDAGDALDAALDPASGGGIGRQEDDRHVCPNCGFAEPRVPHQPHGGPQEDDR